MNTYAKRYSLMSLFDIEDNTIDFDSQDNTKPDKKTPPKQEDNRPWLNDGELLDKAIAKLKAGTTTIEKIKASMKVSKVIEAKLFAAIQ
jgi:ERF superfamily